MKYLCWIVAIVNLVMSFVCIYNNEHIGSIAYLGCALGWKAMAESEDRK